MTGGTYQPGDLWWKASGGRARAWEHVVGVVDYLLETPEEKARRAEDVEHARLYGNRYFKGFGPFQHAKPVPSQRAEERLRANVCKPVVDTATALTAGRNRPKATLITNGGDWTQKRRAKRADRFIEGAFRDAGMYSLGPQLFRDGAIFGTGVIKFCASFGKIKAERTLPSEVIVDPIDGMYERPRCLYQIHYVDRRVLIEEFGASQALLDAIKNAPLVAENEAGVDRTTTAEPVRVIEAWHLRSGPEAKDGKHAIVVHGATLYFEQWDCDRFPFVFFRWSHRVLGFWGTGLIEEIKPLQLDINITLRRIKECLHLMAVPRVFVPATAKVIKQMITNEVGSIVPYAGTTPPVIPAPPSVPPELFRHLQWLIQTAFEQAGVSQLSAASRKPPGLDSGEAIRQYNDLGSERAVIQARDYENAHMEAARIIMDLAEQLDDDGEGYTTVYVAGRRRAEKIKWRDVRLDTEQYVLQVHPTSALPRDAAGRAATVQDWVAAGWIDAATAKRLLDFPDLDAENDLAGAGRDIVDMHLERLLDHPEAETAYVEPEPASDLQYALLRAQQTLCLARMDEAPEERLELLRDYVADVEALLAVASASAANTAPAQAAAPMPQPMQEAA